MNINTALQKLYSMRQMGVKLGLDNIKKLLAHIGNPQEKLKAFHIAGSNGKGSTAAFLASFLMEAGYKTGLYTSPHLVNFNERIRINGEEIPDEYIAGFVNELDDYIEKEEPTFFEITTALAFKYFADNNLDYCVIETGLGGRLDATNTITPIASIITSISLEHTRILGDTLSKIAYEKAGIIKKGIPVFTGYLPVEAKTKIEALSKEKFTTSSYVGDYLSAKNGHYQLQLGDYNINLYDTPLVGNFQFSNLSLAAVAINNTIGIKPEYVLRGVKNVHKNSGIQGRFEIYNQEPLILFDAAHNPEGISATLDSLNKLIKHEIKTNLIFGAMADKNLEEITGLLKNRFDRYFITTINFERAADIPTLKDAFSYHNIKTEPLVEPAEFITKFASEAKNEALIVMGSIYVLGNIKEKLAGKKHLTF